MSKFDTILLSFCGELAGTFPEQSEAINRTKSVTPTQLWRQWQAHLPILASKDSAALFGPARQGFILGAVRLTPVLWLEISEATRTAIWRYLRTLVLEAAVSTNETLSPDAQAVLLDIFTQEKKSRRSNGDISENDPFDIFSESMEHFQPLVDRLKSFFTDTSGGEFPFPEIPERLRNGRIAKMAKEMSSQFKPEDFGINPSLFSGNNIEDVLYGLSNMYQRDPSLLISGAKRIAEKIQKQIQSGSLNREELLAEAQEFISIFKEHPLFKDAIDKFKDMAGGVAGLSSLFGGGSSNDGAPSERRRAVQERLRKKMEQRKGSTQSKE
uniref:Uncharacterized protein n=1 Tax=viral metagenome TaxID=1070528 RepID=A0A6C0D903_9ZZZZ